MVLEPGESVCRIGDLGGWDFKCYVLIGCKLNFSTFGVLIR